MATPQNPLVIDARDLGRRAGSMVELHRVIPAPVDLGVGLARVPVCSDMDVQLRLESVDEGILVRASVCVEVACDCARCLDPVSYDDEMEFIELYRYQPLNARGTAAAEPEQEDEGEERSLFVKDDFVDLEEPLRDAVVLALPIRPLCSPNCLGLCPTCGVRLDDEPDHRHETNDPRWAVLGPLAASLSEQETGDAAEKPSA